MSSAANRTLVQQVLQTQEETEPGTGRTRSGDDGYWVYFGLVRAADGVLSQRRRQTDRECYGLSCEVRAHVVTYEFYEMNWAFMFWGEFHVLLADLLLSDDGMMKWRG